MPQSSLATLHAPPLAYSDKRQQNLLSWGPERTIPYQLLCLLWMSNTTLPDFPAPPHCVLLSLIVCGVICSPFAYNMLSTSQSLFRGTTGMRVGSTHCFSVSPIPDRCPGSICASIACTLLSPLFTPHSYCAPLSWVHLTFSLHKEPQPLDALCPAFSVTVYRAEFTSNSWVLILGKHLVPLSRFLDLGAKLEHV